MVDIITPPGRIVWGNPLIAKGKTDNNNQPVIGQDGKQVMQWNFGLAIPKDQCGNIFAAMQQEAAGIFPNGTPQNFAWKFKDGNGMDDKGQPYANREGYAGHYVFTISTEAFAPRVCRLVGGAYSDMTEGLKTGDYVRAALNIKAHAGKANVRGSVPGLYVNPSLIEFLGYGEEIRNGPDAMALFGGQAVQLPPGASATPIASGPMPGMQPGMQPAMPNGSMMPGNPTGTPMPGAAGAAHHPANPAQPGMQPGNGAFPSNVQPAHDFVQNATGNPQPQGNAPGAAPVPGGAPMPGFPGQR